MTKKCKRVITSSWRTQEPLCHLRIHNRVLIHSCQQCLTITVCHYTFLSSIITVSLCHQTQVIFEAENTCTNHWNASDLFGAPGRTHARAGVITCGHQKQLKPKEGQIWVCLTMAATICHRNRFSSWAISLQRCNKTGENMVCLQSTCQTWGILDIRIYAVRMKPLHVWITRGLSS